MNARGQLAAALLCSLALSACSAAGPSPAPVPSADKPQAAPLHRGPLTDFVSAAGLRWMIVGSPKALMARPGIAKALATVIPAPRFEHFSKNAGLDLRALPSALVAGFDFGTLYMAETSGNNQQVELSFAERLISDPKISSPHPQMRRITGLIGATPQTLVRVEDQWVAVAVGDPTPARVAELFARRRLHKSPAALAGSALRTLPPELASAPLRFYAPGPFEGTWSAGIHGLLQHALAVGIAVRTNEQDQLVARVYVAGAWEEAGIDPRSQLLRAWQDLSQSPLGKLTGLDDPAEEPVISLAAELVSLEVTLSPEPIARGLHAAVAADVWEMMELPRPGR